MEGEWRRRRVAVPTCLLLSLLGGRWLWATRAWGLSVVSSLLSVILSPGGTIIRLGARGCSRTPPSGHLCCGHREDNEWLAEEPIPDPAAPPLSLPSS